MKFLSTMSSMKIITIKDGLFQAQKDGVVYQEYNEKFWNVEGAYDAKELSIALSKLDPEYLVFAEDDKLVLTDEKQIFKLEPQVEDEVLEFPQEFYTWDAKELRALQPFVFNEFPGFFFKEDYIEAVDPEFLARVPNMSPIKAGVFVATKIPTDCIMVAEVENGLWLGFEGSRMLLGRLDVDPYNINKYFEEPWIGTEIPKVAKDRWISCETAYFLDNDILHLHPTTDIDGVPGRGRYAGKYLSRIVKHGKEWNMDDERVLKFRNNQVEGRCATC